MNFCKLMKKTGEKYRIMSKRVDIWPNLHEIFAIAIAKKKNDEYTIGIPFSRQMNEELLKVSTPYSKLSIQKFHKNAMGGGGINVRWLKLK